MDYIFWENNRISKLVLGTAQLGMDYGLANIQGKPTEKEACKIVETAWAHGVNCFDTAQAYGNSEIVLGKALKHCRPSSEAKIISKLSPELQPYDTRSIEKSIEATSQNLGVDQLWCLMLHRFDWLDVWDEGLGQTLVGVKKGGAVKYLGVSVYSTDDARRALMHSDIQVIQMPCNAWDQRMQVEGIFERAIELNKLCFVRSVYLQGLLVLSPSEVAEKLSVASEVAKKWYELTMKFDLKPAQLSLRFGLSLNMPLVIGAENVQQVEDNLKLSEEPQLTFDMIEKIRNEISPLLNENITDPRLWKK